MMRLDDRAWARLMEECDHQRIDPPDDPWSRKVPHLGTAATGVVCLGCGRFYPWEVLVHLMNGDQPDKALGRALQDVILQRAILQESVNALNGALAESRARHAADLSVCGELADEHYKAMRELAALRDRCDRRPLARLRRWLRR